MAYRELELTLVSAQNLKNVNLIARMDVYAVVSISGDPLTRQCTEPDAYGGRNPCWNKTFRFAVPPTASAAASAGTSLHVLLRAERFLGDRDVGEVVVPLVDILAGATGSGPQPPHVASYQVRKLHRWEPRGVLNVSYRLGPVVAPVAPVVVERTSPSKNSAENIYRQRTSTGPPPPATTTGQPTWTTTSPARSTISPAGKRGDGNCALPPHDTGHKEARRAAPAPRTNAMNNGLGQAGQPGPPHVYMGPQTVFFFGSGGPTTTTTGRPTWTTTTSPARSTISPAGKRGDGNWALPPPHDTYASAAAAESMSISVISPRSRKEDRWRPIGLSPSQQHDTQQSSPVAPSHRLAASSPFSSCSSSSSAHPSPSSSFSAHSSPHSPYASSAHPASTATSPHPPLRPPVGNGAAEVTHGNNNGFRSTSSYRGGGAAISLPLPSPSPIVPNHSNVVN